MRPFTWNFVAAVALLTLAIIVVLEFTVGLILFPIRALIGPAVIAWVLVGAAVTKTHGRTLPADTARFDLTGAARSIVLWVQWPRLLRRG